MSDDDTTPDVSEQGHRYVLARDADGWGIWKVDSPDDALIRYGDGDDAYQQASDFFRTLEHKRGAQSGRWLDVLRVVALISGVVWIAARIYYEARTVAVDHTNFTSTDNLIDQLNWAQAIADVAYALFLFSAVAYVILWLRRRDGSRSEDP